MNHFTTLVPRLILGIMALVLVLGAIPAHAATPNLKPAIKPGPLSHREELRATVNARAKVTHVELRIDNKKVQPWVRAHAGWRYTVSYPLTKVAVGKHTARLQVRDQQNRSTQRQWQFQKLAQIALSADRLTVQPGEKVVLTAQGFTPGTPVTIGMGGQNTGVGGNYGSAVANNEGAFTVEVMLDKFPDGSPLYAGTITLLAHNLDGSEKAGVEVRILADPSISLNKSIIKAGEKVTVSGQGFTPATSISISLGGVNTGASGNYGDAVANSSGRFSVEVLLDRSPDGSVLKPGPVVLLAHTGDFAEKASAQLQVQASPTLTASKTAVRVGEWITLSGEGFTPGKVVTIRLAGIDMGHGTNYGTAAIDANGRFSMQLFLGRYPDGTPLPPGGMSLMAMTADGEQALVGMQVLAAPSVSALTTVIQPGDPITLKGEGFVPGTTLILSMASNGAAPGGNVGAAVVDANGHFVLTTKLTQLPNGSPLQPGPLMLVVHDPTWTQQASVQIRIADRIPAAPSDLRMTSLTKGATSAEPTLVGLQWRDNASNETGFRIQATFTRMNGGTDTQAWSVPANATTAQLSFIAGGINPVRKACFTVAAFTGQAGTVAVSSPSNEVCAVP